MARRFPCFPLWGGGLQSRLTEGAARGSTVALPKAPSHRHCCVPTRTRPGHRAIRAGLVCCGALRTPRTILPLWHARLAAWPGLLTVLSVLAVMLGTPTRVPEQAPRLTAGTVTPLMPELRAVPQPSPGVPVLPPPAPRPEWAVPMPLLAALFTATWAAEGRRPDLTVLGRRQTDGG